jgi:hypothetical protein
MGTDQTWVTVLHVRLLVLGPVVDAQPSDKLSRVRINQEAGHIRLPNVEASSVQSNFSTASTSLSI